MTTKVKMWGNSLSVRIPREVSRKLCFTEDSEVEIELRNKEIRIRPVQRSAPILKDLVKGITPGNRHEVVFDDGFVGKEAW